MKSKKDPRLSETRNKALNTAVKIAENKGILAVTHATVNKGTGISRSTLYRHWPDINKLRNDTFKQSAKADGTNIKTNGSLRADLVWLLSFLLTALNKRPWGKIVPQVIATAAVDDDAHKIISDFMEERIASVEKIFFRC